MRRVKDWFKHQKRFLVVVVTITHIPMRELAIKKITFYPW